MSVTEGKGSRHVCGTRSGTGSPRRHVPRTLWRRKKLYKIRYISYKVPYRAELQIPTSHTVLDTEKPQD